MIRIDDLIQKIKNYAPKADFDIFYRAYVYSAQLHRDRFTPGGRPVLEYGLEVSHLLADFKLDISCIVAGLLQDVLSEGLAEEKDLTEMVGQDTTTLIKELSFLHRAQFHSSEAARAEHMRQMILASTRDLRVILILLADRLQNLRDAKKSSDLDHTTLAREALAIYAPIAHRLGVHFIKAEMEDLAFETLEPRVFTRLKQEVEKRISVRQLRIEEINEYLRQLLEKNHLKGEVLGRTKHLFSIHNKMKSDKLPLDGIYDLLATRIILSTTEECYRVLGLIHATYTPLPRRFKDYIALPKSNGYQSLHTYVFGPNGDIFEIQIRTIGMHRNAEMGIAAHFAYKDGSQTDEKELGQVNWFRHLLSNLEEGQNPMESMEILTRDLEEDQIFVFTPTGEVIKLPQRATPIDFAYSIHSQVGHTCVGAKVDDRMISLRSPLKNGSVVNILTDNRQTPKKDWLKFAVTSRALSRIRNHLRGVEKMAAAEKGKELVTRAARRLVKKPEDLFTLEPFADWARKRSLKSVEELYGETGVGKMDISEVLEKLFPTEQPKLPTTLVKKSPARKKKSLVQVEGLDNIPVRFAKCCSPVYGDPIKGIITQGRGVSVHHPDCHNLGQQVYDQGRVVQTAWVEANKGPRPVNLVITARKSMKDLISLIGLLEEDEGLTLNSGSITSRNGVYTQLLTFDMEDSGKLKRILTRMNAMPGIHAERVLQ